MKKEFETPVCELVEFDTEDVITTSNIPTTPEYPVQ